jgi:RNA polymerase sigma-70 factor (ECF subfamily)
MALDADALFRRHHLPLFRYLVRLSGDESAARDAVQHAFLKLLESPPRPHNVRAWIYRVATNALRETKRTEQRRATLRTEQAPRMPVGDPPLAPDRLAERRQAREQLHRALDEMRERDRTLLLLRAEGFTHREMAEAVGTTTGSVGTLIARALERLSTILDSHGGDAA